MTGPATRLADDGADKGIVAGSLVVGILTFVVLLIFARLGHVWPRWALLVLVVIAIVSLLVSFELRSLLAIFDVVALLLLVFGWQGDLPVEPR